MAGCKACWMSSPRNESVIQVSKSLCSCYTGESVGDEKGREDGVQEDCIHGKHGPYVPQVIYCPGPRGG